MNETKAERGLQIVANLATVMAALRGVAYLVVIIGLPIAVSKIVPLIERVIPIADRAVVVLENLDRKADQAFHAMAPIGREAIGKGVDTLRSMDAKAIGEGITETIQDRLRKLKK